MRRVSKLAVARSLEDGRAAEATCSASGRGVVGFTLIELLIVVSIIALLVAIVLPSLHKARAQGRAVVCLSGLRQLHMANTHYAMENHDLYVPAASDILDGFGGRHRWHGVREAAGVDPDPAKNTFDPLKGPLADSLYDGRVKECPESVRYWTEGVDNAFEAGCGGYGYNQVGIGSRLYQASWSREDLKRENARHLQTGWLTTAIAKPADTVMFTDTAHRQYHTQRGFYLTEYSFCEPPFPVSATVAGPMWYEGPSDNDLYLPTIHFRHLERANVIWSDGHANAQKMSFTRGDYEAFDLGWFGPRSNELFDPF